MKIKSFLLVLVFLPFVCKAQHYNGFIPCRSYISGIYGEQIDNIEVQNQGLIVFGFSIYTSSQQQWDRLADSQLHDFYQEYGPEGQNKVRLQIRFISDDPLFYDCLCCVDGSGNCPSSIGNWTTIMPASTDAYFDDGTAEFVDSTICDGSPQFFSNPQPGGIGFLMPNGKSYTIPTFQAIPTFEEYELMFTVFDALNDPSNAELMFTTMDSQDHCSGESRSLGQIYLSNNGTEPLTQANIGIGWNGVMQDIHNWEGYILPYHLTVLEDLEESILMDSDSGQLEIYIMSINNGQPDPENEFDTLRVFSPGVNHIVDDSIIVEWKTSNFSEYTYMDIIAEDSTFLFRVGDTMILQDQQVITTDSFLNNTVYQFPVSLVGYGGQCLKFRGFDYGGGYLGNYVKIYVSGDLVLDITETTGSDHYLQRSLYTTFPAPVPTHDLNVPIAIKPNPTSGEVTVSATLPSSGPCSWSVTNSLGQRVWQQGTDDVLGATTVHFDTSNWSNGVYFVTLQHDEAVSSVLLVVQH
jgi:Secretion system C-terminal sorting domain